MQLFKSNQGSMAATGTLVSQTLCKNRGFCLVLHATVLRQHVSLPPLVSQFR